jgi:2-C-methyl-D-erythritol 4-phosphate cytidylyltransferase
MPWVSDKDGGAGGRVDALVVAAGSSRRMGGGRNKVLQPLAGKRVLEYSLETFERSPCVNRVRIVVREEERNEVSALVQGGGYGCVRPPLIAGGDERFDSVKNGLEGMAEDAPGVVLIHDAARPFVDPEKVRELVEMTWEKGAVVIGHPAIDTLKRTRDGERIEEDVGRSGVWQVQTPQAFRYPSALEAYRKWDREEAAPTDDTAVVSASGLPVFLLDGGPYNIKVTTPQDMGVAAALIERGVFSWIPPPSRRPQR